MDLADLISPDRVAIGWRATGKAEVLRDLSRRAAVATGHEPAALQAALEEREALGSTGVGGGIAIPHARIIGLSAFFGFFARLEKPIDFEAVDDRPVDLLFLLLVPSDAADRHLQALAAVSRRLRDPATAAALRQATSAEAAYRLLVAPPSG